jgi:hypothetical protein
MTALLLSNGTAARQRIDVMGQQAAAMSKTIYPENCSFNDLADNAARVACGEHASGMSLVTTLAAPITARCPIRTPGRIIAPPLTHIRSNLNRLAKLLVPSLGTIQRNYAI